MAEELGLKDIWKERNPDKKQCTYYSASHTSWSRLDMLWTNVEIEHNIKEIETNTWANHNPIKIIWKGLKKNRMLNKEILKEKECVKIMEKELEFFLKENKKQQTSIPNLWDTTKAYIRGLAISYNTRRYKEKNGEQSKLLDTLKELEKNIRKNTT
uniref:Endonuclease/exonuclease/phosphatase domain-containing protein n=1 Tax=Micrurus lemniscatus lemniscatus TaxID=129467 RepID=A0A2D4HAY5_MICLE